MPLIKSIAGHFHPDRGWVEQQDIEMHPLEEALIIAYWEHGEIERQLPQKPSASDEMSVLISDGVDRVRHKRTEWQENYDKLILELKKSELNIQEKQVIWDTHANLCKANGHNPDTYSGNAIDSLPPPLPLKESEDAINEII